MSNSNATSQRFEDFDQKSVFAKFESSVLRAESLNFVLEFDSKKARGALDLDLDGVKQMLASKV